MEFPTDAPWAWGGREAAGRVATIAISEAAPTTSKSGEANNKTRKHKRFRQYPNHRVLRSLYLGVCLSLLLHRGLILHCYSAPLRALPTYPSLIGPPVLPGKSVLP